MRYARIEDSLVANVILWDGEASYPGDGLVQLPDDSPVGVGWALEGDEWIAPESEPLQEPPNPNLAQKLAAMQKLIADFGFTEEMARAVVGMPYAT